MPSRHSSPRYLRPQRLGVKVVVMAVGMLTLVQVLRGRRRIRERRGRAEGRNGSARDRAGSLKDVTPRLHLLLFAAPADGVCIRVLGRSYESGSMEVGRVRPSAADTIAACGASCRRPLPYRRRE